MKKLAYGFLALLLIFSIGILISANLFKEHLNPKVIKEKIEGYGAWAPIIVMLIIIAICFVSIVPHTPFIIASGYMFGAFKGTLYTLSAEILGITAVFFLARIYGRPLARRLVGKKELRKADLFFHKKGVIALLIARIIPMFPDNVVCASSGLTKMKYRTFIIVSLAIIIPAGILQSYLGNQISGIENVDKLAAVISSLALIVSIILISCFLFRRRIKKMFKRSKAGRKKD